MDDIALTAGQRWWHGTHATIVAVSLVTQLLLLPRETRAVVNLVSYFTIESNLLVMVTAAVLASGRVPTGRWWPVLRLAGLTGITVTLVVFAVAIGPYLELDGLEWWLDKAFHYVSPLMAIIGFVWVGPRTRLERRDLVFLAWPVVWVGYTLVRGTVSEPQFMAATGGTSNFPYTFLDVDAHGAASVAVAVGVVTAVVVATAMAYLWLSRLLAERDQSSSPRSAL